MHPRNVLHTNEIFFFFNGVAHSDSNILAIFNLKFFYFFVIIMSWFSEQIILRKMKITEFNWNFQIVILQFYINIQFFWCIYKIRFFFYNKDLGNPEHRSSSPVVQTGPTIFFYSYPVKYNLFFPSCSQFIHKYYFLLIQFSSTFQFSLNLPSCLFSILFVTFFSLNYDIFSWWSIQENGGNLK